MISLLSVVNDSGSLRLIVLTHSIQPRAVIPENLAPAAVAHVFDLEELIESVRKVRVDVRVVGGDENVVVAAS